MWKAPRPSSASFQRSGVHAEEFGGEKRSFIASSAGANFKNDVLLVVRIFGEQQELEFFFDGGHAGFQPIELFLSISTHVGIFFVREESLAFGDALCQIFDTRDTSPR